MLTCKNHTHISFRNSDGKIYAVLLTEFCVVMSSAGSIFMGDSGCNGISYRGGLTFVMSPSAINKSRYILLFNTQTHI